MSWRGKGSTSGWRKVRAYILKRDRYECQIKGPRCTVLATAVDHMAPWFGRPEDVPSNLLRAACEACNKKLRDTHHHDTPAPRKVTRW